MKSQALYSFISSESVLHRFGAASPKSPIFSQTQSQIDSSVSHFLENATDWRSIAAMTVGGLAYGWGKAAAFTLGGGHVGAMPLRILSIGVGLGSEVTAFELTNRTLQTFRTRDQNRSPVTDHRSPNLWSWSGPGGLQKGLLSSLITFSTLKTFGRLTAGENLIVQHGTQDVAMAAGHQLLHWAELGEKPVGTWGEQLLRAEETNLQLGLGMQLAHAFAPRLLAAQRNLSLIETPFMEGSPRGWENLLGRNSLFSIGPFTGLGDFFREVHEKIGTTPLILTGLSLVGLFAGKMIYSRYKASANRWKETNDLDLNSSAVDGEDFGVVSPPKVRPHFFMSLADIILFDESQNLLSRIRKVEEGLSHPDFNIRAYLVETLGKLLPNLAMKDRPECVRKIEGMMNDPHLQVRLQALKTLGWSLQFLLREERGPFFSKVESYWGDPHPLLRQAAVDLILENLNFLPLEEKSKWVEKMQVHMKSPHLEIRVGAFEALNFLESNNSSSF